MAPGPAWKLVLNGREMLVGLKISDISINVVFRIEDLESSGKKLCPCAEILVMRSPFSRLCGALLSFAER